MCRFLCQKPKKVWNWSCLCCHWSCIGCHCFFQTTPLWESHIINNVYNVVPENTYPPQKVFFVSTPHPLRISNPEGFVKTPFPTGISIFYPHFRTSWNFQVVLYKSHGKLTADTVTINYPVFLLFFYCGHMRHCYFRFILLLIRKKSLQCLISFRRLKIMQWLPAACSLIIIVRIIEGEI